VELRDFALARKVIETEIGTFEFVDIGDGPPALFIHGVFNSPYLWRDVFDGVKDQRRCIGYFLPGHGATRVRQPDGLSLAKHADLLAAFCEALALESADVVANDTGGAIAQAFVVHHRERIRTLTLTNCEARDVLPSRNEFAELIGQLAAEGQLAPALVSAATSLEVARGDLGMGPVLQSPERLSWEDVIGYLHPHQATLPNAKAIEKVLSGLDATQLIALEEGLRQTDVPTALVWGTADQIFELELAYWLRDAIPTCDEVVEIEGGKLFWPGERGPELVPHLVQHWREVSVA
jgi:pimeloyl-ACP methyl ester carboxylesterase